MPVSLTDQDIADLLREPKPLPDDYLARMQLRAKRGHREREWKSAAAVEASSS